MDEINAKGRALWRSFLDANPMLAAEIRAKVARDRAGVAEEIAVMDEQSKDALRVEAKLVDQLADAQEEVARLQGALNEAAREAVIEHAFDPTDERVAKVIKDWERDAEEAPGATAEHMRIIANERRLAQEKARG